MTTAESTRNFGGKTTLIDIKKINEELGKVGYLISAGYGKMKDTSFRIAHMGEIQMEDIERLIAAMDEYLGAMTSVTPSQSLNPGILLWMYAGLNFMRV